MIGILLGDYDSELNENAYKAGQRVKVTEIDGFSNDYVIYRYGGLDWIPKKLVRIV